MSDRDKCWIGAILVGIGLALWLFFGLGIIFALEDDNFVNSATVWAGVTAALACLGVGIPLVVRFERRC